MRRKAVWLTCAAMVALTMLVAVASQADVRLPHVFGSHMVLQRDVAVAVWGWADAGEEVSVKLGDAAAVKATAGEDGKWTVKLAPMAAGGPVTLTVTGKNSITLDDVLIGEVWLCSGQSNMEMAVASCDNAQEEIAKANHPRIRHIKIPRIPQSLPVDDVDATWQICSPETVGGFSGAAYFFGRHLQEELDVPIGLVNSSWGGTRIEPWTPPVGFEGVPSLEGIVSQVRLSDPRTDEYKTALSDYLKTTEDWLALARESMAAEKLLQASPGYPNALLPMTSHQQPTTLYNGMLYPLVPFAIRGAIWYQGESNHGEGMLYADKTRALVEGWRKVWGQPDLPFYYVQIAPYQYGAEDPHVMPRFWEAQAAALEIPNTGMAVIHDVGNTQDIHPKNKQEVGRRLGLLAMAKTYGHTDVVHSGPTFKSMAIEGDKLRLSFDNIGTGLASRNGKPLDWFEILGMETNFVKADAVIEGDTVVLSSPEVKQPVALRFAWDKLAEPNLMNKEGLPAWPFRAGEVPKRNPAAKLVDEATDYELVYEFDIANAGSDIKYTTDDHATIPEPFDRIAYFLQLQKGDNEPQWVYVSMDAFTTDISKIGIPSIASKAVFQTKVANMNVYSNVDGIATGVGLGGGNIEFWPHNYGPQNSIGIPNAAADVWDFGDGYSAPEDGYGSMQVHNNAAKQTIFAFNNWKAAGSADVGIGNSDGDTRDWTFKKNASEYKTKGLWVLVRVKK